MPAERSHIIQLQHKVTRQLLLHAKVVLHRIGNFIIRISSITRIRRQPIFENKSLDFSKNRTDGDDNCRLEQCQSTAGVKTVMDRIAKHC